MHQQVRTSTTRSGGVGAMAQPGSVVDILQILVDEGVNLQTAGGRDLDGRGEFVFAVHHDEGDDEPDRRAAELLKKHGYRARVVKVHQCDVSDEPGGLLGCIQRVEESEGPVYEIFVGTPGERGIPVQITTRSAVAAGEDDYEGNTEAAS